MSLPRRIAAALLLVASIGPTQAQAQAAESAPRVSSDAQAAAAQKQERALLRQHIDAQMRDVGRGNGEWAVPTERDLRATLQAADISGLRVRELSCAENFCRLVIEHRDWQSQEALMEKTEGKPGFRLPGKAHLEVDVGGSAISYIYVRNPQVDWPQIGAAA
ncbi:MAG: hypothetical protein ABI411_21610, partial [Tahibacter sp.]